MVHIPFFSLFSLQAALNPFSKQEPVSTNAVAYYNPLLHGGSLLDRAPNTGNPPLGEPLNVIISGASAPKVLTDAGFERYTNAFGFSHECFGAHLGDPQTANLGDGNGWVNQTYELRQDYGNVDIGSCLESLLGGNHFRLFRQNGPGANSGALFLGFSEEENLSKHHTISPDGYNKGRDAFVNSAKGVKKYKGVKYSTEVEYITGLLPAGSQGVNHNITTDGRTALLTITIL